MSKILKNRRYLAIVLATIAGFTIYFLSRETNNYIRISSIVWTTEYHITYQGDCDMTDSINTIFNIIDNSLSMFNPQSTISRINANDTSVAPHPYVSKLFLRSLDIYKETKGFYDPSVAPLVNLWGFGFQKGDTLPDQDKINEALNYVGLDKMHLDSCGRLIKTHKQSVIDFSSIAKGFACDEIGRMFQRNKITNYIIEIGGEISMHGKNPKGENWNVSIDQPIESNDSIIHKSAVVLSLTNKGIATSGNYRNYRKQNGEKITHIINPNTGYPEISNLLSATIIAENAADADAYATACMVMGTERSIALINNNKSIEGMLIYVENNALKKWYSKGVKEFIKNDLNTNN